jgi:hypothetical protein
VGQASRYFENLLLGCTSLSSPAAGVNLFNPSANTSVFADVTLRRQYRRVGGKAGMRVSW